MLSKIKQKIKEGFLRDLVAEMRWICGYARRYRRGIALYVLLGVKEVWAGVMSEAAAEVLIRHGIACAQDKLVDHIINRSGTGICPFEEAVLEIHTPAEALAAIREKMAEMNITL